MMGAAVPGRRDGRAAGAPLHPPVSLRPSPTPAPRRPRWGSATCRRSDGGSQARRPLHNRPAQGPPPNFRLPGSMATAPATARGGPGWTRACVAAPAQLRFSFAWEGCGFLARSEPLRSPRPTAPMTRGCLRCGRWGSEPNVYLEGRRKAKSWRRQGGASLPCLSAHARVRRAENAPAPAQRRRDPIVCKARVCKVCFLAALGFLASGSCP